MSNRPDSQKPSDPCNNPSQESNLSGFERIVHDYRKTYQQDIERLLCFYASQPSFRKAAEVIGLAQLPSGNRHPHQRRIPRQVLDQVRSALLDVQNQLEKCGRFADLFRTVENAIGNIRGVGALMTYDTAHRLGAYFGLEPKSVYLHQGAKEGAKAIGVNHRRDKVEVRELPEPLRRLKPYELEDCLCIYKDDLRRAAGKDAV